MPALKGGKIPKPQRSQTTETMLSRRAAMRSPMSALLGVLAGGFIAATPALAQSRGELLYSTHCISCHTQQMHWRDQRAATDWNSLQVQVRRWQGAASLGWTEVDVLEVARYLNATIYRFEQTAEPRTSQRPVTKPSAGARPPGPVGRSSGVGSRNAAS